MAASIPRLRLSPAACAAVRAQHPWVFRERGTYGRPGQIVELADRGGRLLGWGVADEGSIAVRVLGRGAPPEGAESIPSALRVRLEAAVRWRQRIQPPHTDCLRLVHGAGDGLPGLVVDRYGELLVLRLYAQAWEPWLPTILTQLQRVEGVRRIARRLGVRRVDGSQGLRCLHGGPVPEVLEVQERGVRLIVRPEHGQKTGLFLDQREHRHWIRRISQAGDRVANLFGYNGGFSVAAALGGAERVVTVDSAPEALEDARRIFALNGISTERHGFEVADAFEWHSPAPVDLLILDPPSMARRRAARARARARYQALHAHYGPQVKVGGVLASSSCTSRVSRSDWRAAVRDGLGEGAWSWAWISAEPPDHPVALGHSEGHYLDFALLRRLR